MSTAVKDRPMLSSQDVADGLRALLREHQAPPAPHTFPHVVVDSRQAGPGDLFVALPGEHHDGHDFIPDALDRGARGVIACRRADVPEDVACYVVPDALAALQALASYWRGRMPVRVVGVTGSVGKTSTKEIIAAVLGQRFSVLKNHGNQNNEVGLPLSVLKLTPEHQRAVLEMGMYAEGEIRTLCRIARPQVGVVTNVRPMHLERLGTMDAIARAKHELPQSLPPEGWAILNGDDALAASMAVRTDARVLLYGTSADCDVRAEDVDTSAVDRARFTLRYRGHAAPVEVALPGRHNVYNSLAAAAVAFTEGFTVDDAAALLHHARPETRLRWVPGRNGSTLLDDTYNASPDSVLAALDVLERTRGRKGAVLGDMLELGSQERPGHVMVGRRAAQVLDWLVTVGPRARIIAEAARDAGLADVAAHETKDTAEQDVARRLAPDYHVLFKGSRGMALETIVERLKAD